MAEIGNQSYDTRCNERIVKYVTLSGGQVLKAINSQIKLVALSVSLLISVDTMAGLGGLRVNSSLGQPFSASVVVTGEEAKELLNGGKVNLSDSRLRASVQKSGNNAVITLRSSSAINDPVMIFQIGVGSQARQYTAIIDPPGYRSNSPSRHANTNSHNNGDNGNSNGNGAYAQNSTPSRSSSQPTNAHNSRMPVLVQSQQPIVAPNNSEMANTADSATTAHSSVSPSSAQNEPPRQQVAPSKPKRGNRYQAKSGETLNSIAARVRPSGLTLEETKRAIIRANPHLFRKGHVNRALTGANLYIPTTAELNRLGRRPIQAPATAAAGAAVGAATIAAVTPQEAMDNETAASAPTAALASAAQTTAASVPESHATPTMASAAASEAITEGIASEVAASEVVEVTPPIQTPATEQAPALESNEELIPWQALVFGGVGVIALLVLLWALSKRKGGLGKRGKAKENEDADPFQANENKGIRTHQPVANPSNPPVTLTKEAAAAQLAANAENTKSSEEDFGGFDDDIFFEPTKVQHTKDDNFSNFDFNSLDLDKQQGGIVSSAITNDKETQRRKNLDWDKEESTESVFEPDDFNDITSFDNVGVATNTVSLSKSSETSPLASDNEFDINNLNIDADQSMSLSSTKKSAAPVSNPTDETDGISFKPLDFSNNDDLSFNSPAKPVLDEPKEPERMSWASSVPREPAKPVFFDLSKDHPEPMVIQTANSTTPVKPVLEEPIAPVAPEPVKEVTEVKPEPKPISTPEISVEPMAIEPVADKITEPVVTPTLDSFELEENQSTLPSFESLEAFNLADNKPVISAATSDTFEIEEQQSVTSTPISTATTSNTHTLEWDESTVTPAAQPVAEVVSSKSDETALDFEVEIPEIPEPVSMQTVTSITTPNAVPTTSPVTPTVSNIDDSNDIAGFSLLNEPTQTTVDNTLSWSSNEEIGLVEVPTTPIEETTPIVEWNDIHVEVGSTTVAEPGFVSESVGMTAPLEAKYELAEMYIEIGDPDAARETLQELIDESTGEIQAKSQALLNTLD